MKWNLSEHVSYVSRKAHTENKICLKTTPGQAKPKQLNLSDSKAKVLSGIEAAKSRSLFWSLRTLKVLSLSIALLRFPNPQHEVTV